MAAALEAAPFDDEPYTADDCAASDAGWAGYQRGEAIKVGELDERSSVSTRTPA
jgi:hypothetical protein